MILTKIATFLLYIIYLSSAFTTNNIGCERTIYKNYLLGLRKTRKILSNANNTLQLIQNNPVLK